MTTKWAESLFIKNAKLYAMILNSMWQDGADYAKLISDLLIQKRLERCRILDVPCGIGRVSVPLAKLGYTVTGLDISPYFVSMAKKKATRFKVSNRTSFILGEMKNFNSLLSSNSFDVALNIFTSIGYGSEDDDLLFFKNLRQVVRKGGYFIIGRLGNRDYIFSHFIRHIYDETDRLLVLHDNEPDISHSRERSNWRFYLKKSKGRSLKLVTENFIDLRLYSPHEVLSMLENSGWKVSAIYNSLMFKRPFSPDNSSFTVIAQAN